MLIVWVISVLVTVVSSYTNGHLYGFISLFQYIATSCNVQLVYFGIYDMAYV